MRDFYKLTYRKNKAKLREQAIEWQGDFACLLRKGREKMRTHKRV